MIQDELYDDAVSIARNYGEITPRALQVHLRIGWGRANDLLVELERNRVIGAEDGLKPRKYLWAAQGEK